MVIPYQLNSLAANFASRKLINDRIRARITCDMPYGTQAFQGNQRFLGFLIKGLNMVVNDCPKRDGPPVCCHEQIGNMRL